MSAATKIPASVRLKGALNDSDSTHGEEHAGKHFLCDCWRVKKGREEGRKKEKERKRKGNKKKASSSNTDLPSATW